MVSFSVVIMKNILHKFNNKTLKQKFYLMSLVINIKL